MECQGAPRGAAPVHARNCELGSLSRTRGPYAASSSLDVGEEKKLNQIEKRPQIPDGLFSAPLFSKLKHEDMKHCPAQ